MNEVPMCLLADKKFILFFTNLLKLLGSFCCHCLVEQEALRHIQQKLPPGYLPLKDFFSSF